jgi:ABC-type transport system involved in multi-copper enzyme maturation permease subunit
MLPEPARPPGRLARALARLHPAYLAWAIPGPIFHKEMWMVGRRSGTYVIRGLYTLALLGLVSMVYIGMRLEGGGGSTESLQRYQTIAPTIAYTAAWFQFFALSVAAIIFAAPAICDEKRSGTLGTLLTTPLTSWQITLGKLLATSTQLIVLALISAPILLALRLFGGVTAEFVLGSQCLTISAGLLAASLALFASIGAQRSATAAGFALVMFLGLLGLGPLLLWGVQSTGRPVPPEHYIISSPIAGMAMLYQEIRPGTMPAGVARIGWVGGSLFSLSLAALLFGATTFRLRRVMRREGDAGTPTPAPAAPPAAPAVAPADSASTPPTSTDQAATPPQALPVEPTASVASDPAAGTIRTRAASREVGDRPIFWREFRQPFFRAPWQAWAASIVTGVLLLFIYGRVGFDDLGDEILQYPLAVIGTLLLMLLAIFMSTSLISGERESRTWDALLASPLSAWEIVSQKFAGSLRKLGFVLGVIAAHFLLMSLLLHIHPLTLVLLPLAILPPVLAVSATGVMFSTLLAKSVRAAAANFALWIGVWGGLPMLAAISTLGLRGGEDQIISIAMFPNPMGMTVVTLTGLVEMPSNWDSSRMLRFEYYGLGRMSLAGFSLLLVLYAGLYLFVTWLALYLGALRIARQTGRAR